MTDELVVACVLRSGGVYTPLWVKRLKAMVERDLSLPHRFVCLSDQPISGVDVIPLKHPWPKYWAKIELFGPSLAYAKRVMYLDLDVVTTGPLDDLLEHPAPMIFAPPHPVMMGIENPPPPRRKGVIYKYQTSCMAWSPPEGGSIYNAFKEKHMRMFASDQDWIATVYPNCPTYPVAWFRKLRQCYNGPPDGVKVVLCMPEKNHEAIQKYPWVRERWIDGNLLSTEVSVAHTGH